MEAENAGEHLNTCMCVLVHPHTLMPVGSTDSGRIWGVSAACVHICRGEYARLRGRDSGEWSIIPHRLNFRNVGCTHG